MATHSSILVWRTPWTEKPGGLQSIGSHIFELKQLSTHGGERAQCFVGIKIFFYVCEVDYEGREGNQSIPLWKIINSQKKATKEGKRTRDIQNNQKTVFKIALASPCVRACSAASVMSYFL